MRTLLLSVTGLLAGAVALYIAHYRWRVRELALAAQEREALLARLARDEPLPPNVSLEFPAEHPATGRPEPSVRREAFLSALAAGPYRYPSTVYGYTPQGTWAAGLWKSPTAAQTYQMADGRLFDVLTRRHANGWRLAVVMPWPPGM